LNPRRQGKSEQKKKIRGTAKLKPVPQTFKVKITTALALRTSLKVAVIVFKFLSVSLTLTRVVDG